MATAESSKRATQKWRENNPEKFKECAKRATYRWRDKNLASFRKKRAAYMRRYRQRKRQQEDALVSPLL